uniref:PPIase cyclophilin-type domain-containing protein n=1 Tax=Kalanchoe fedtschenkoi TaxID=63787 RepID=A0A7N0RF10_KALFE
MSNIYVSEPPTKGKVVLHTTYGPLDIELWPKEAPKAVRNFVQLCLEGYYDNTIFHRIIKGFMVQGGDPTGTGNGGESIYGKPFADEFHTRLRFKYRGLVACANAGAPNTNGSQFFISLDRCDWLDKKNTIFGKVTGDSVYNLPNIGEVETDKDDRPFDPAPKIKSVEILWNPFDDIIPRVTAKPLPSSTTDTDNKETKKKPVKKLNLLSFGEEAEEEEKELSVVKQKIKSSHDVLDDPRLLKEDVPNKELDPSEAKAKKELQLSVREALVSKREESKEDLLTEAATSAGNSDDDEAYFDARMRQQILMKRKEMVDAPAKKKSSRGSTSSKVREASPPRADAEIEDLPKKDKLYLKKKGIGSDARAERMAKADSDVQLLNESERARHLQKLKKRRIKGREDDVLAKLEKFKQALTQGEPDGKGNVLDLREVKLQFAPESGKDNMTRTNNPNDYVVVDPLLEKGKEKFNRMQAKEKRRNREWAGKSLT